MKISSLLRVHPRFMRSVHLERDIKDPTSSHGYILTPVAHQALDRIGRGFKPQSTQRAWRLAGDYGSGKTDFALALARIAEGRVNELPKALRRFVGGNTFKSAIATGDNEPLGITVLRALGQKWDDRRKGPSTEEVLQAIRVSVASAKRHRHSGVTIILDELGKNLEFAARHPDSGDIFLLQRLAEEASRSGDDAFMVVVTLHQGVAAYSAGLSSVAKQEWVKIAGRFEEIVYAHSTEQATALVAATLNVATHRLPGSLKSDSTDAMKTAIKAGLYGAAAPMSLVGLGPQIFPLHPIMVPVLLRTMRRFGQNERSLFSFISSSEPLGLQQHVSQAMEEAGHYRIHHFFDYVRLNLLPSVSAGNSHTYWGVIESVLASSPPETPEEDAVLKTIAMLSLLDAPDLPANESIVRAAVGGAKKAVFSAIENLRRRGVIYERGAVNSLCLWPHTAVNLDELFAKALEASAGKGDGVTQLCAHVRSEHLVPRAYYAKTGTLRYAGVDLVPAASLTELLANQPRLKGKGTDLNLWVILPADESQQRAAKQLLANRSKELAEGLFVGIVDPPNLAIAALRDVIAWEWAMRNSTELSGDRYAREEVTRQINQAKRDLRVRLDGLNNLAVPTGSEIEWYHRNSSTPQKLAPGPSLLAFLGEECARVYPQTPAVLNELINRRMPSGAAISARTKLAEAMATAPDQRNLGMDDSKRPAEMALYLSIIQGGGFHVEDEERWFFRLPSTRKDRCKLLPAISFITETLKTRGVDSLVPISDIFEGLSLPPYGIREGLHPVILAIYLATHHQQVALYEDGTYLLDVGGDAFLRMMKEPEFFHLQYCKLNTVRAEVFSRLLKALKIPPRDASHADLIDLVRPLAIFIAQEIPDYCRQTKKLSAISIGVRSALLEGREPIKLVFTTLPKACGLSPIGNGAFDAADQLAAKLKTSLHEIRSAYPRLVDGLRKAIFAAFDIEVANPSGRRLLADRAAQLAAVISDPVLKSFALRIGDLALDDKGWVESVANLLARKSPERWADSDETEFQHQLEVSAGRFKRTEMTFIGTTAKLNGHVCRLALTKSDGSEVGDLVNWEGLDESRIDDLQNEIQKLLAKHGRYGLAAATRALWKSLNVEPSKKS